MPDKLSYDDFLESLRLSPRLVVELVIENNKREILLLKRDNDPFKDYWHLPGGFLLKGESISACIKRHAKEELGISPTDSGKFIGIFENIDGDPRGHILHYVVRFEQDQNVEGSYFSKLPQETIPYQRKFLLELGYK